MTQQKIHDAKQKFGIDYMDLLLQGGSPSALQDCVDQSLEEITRLLGKLEKYEGTIATNKLKLESKLHKPTILLPSKLVSVSILLPG